MKMYLAQSEEEWCIWRKEDHAPISPMFESVEAVLEFAKETDWLNQLDLSYEGEDQMINIKVDPTKTIHFRLDNDNGYAYVEKWDDNLICSCSVFGIIKNCSHVRHVRNSGLDVENQLSPEITPMETLIRQQQDYVYGVTLETWSVVPEDETNVYVDPNHGKVGCFHGIVEGEGFVKTSPICGILWDCQPYGSREFTSNSKFLTLSGTLYRLGTVDSAYEQAYPNAQQRLIRVLETNLLASPGARARFGIATSNRVSRKVEV